MINNYFTALEQAQGGSLLVSVLIFGVMFLVMYFVAIRPSKKQEQEVKKMREYFHNAVADDLNLYVEEVVPDTDGTLVIGGPNKKEDYGALVTPK